jgi:hypothetical protein
MVAIFGSGRGWFDARYHLRAVGSSFSRFSQNRVFDFKSIFHSVRKIAAVNSNEPFITTVAQAGAKNGNS